MPPATCCSVIDRRLLRLAVLRRRLDAGRARAALRDRRAVPRRRALLVGVRAGRLDAEPVRAIAPRARRFSAGSSRAAASSRCSRCSSSRSRRSSRGCGCGSGAREPSSPTKFALGLSSSAPASRCWSSPAQLVGQRREGQPVWLVVTYLLHTFGELSLSPVGLSAMTKLAPARIVGPDDGRLVPGDLGRQLHRRPHRRRSTTSMPLPSLFGAVAPFGHRRRRRDVRARRRRSSG